jgi:predicted Zn-dependent protease with MMP-like domain
MSLPQDKFEELVITALEKLPQIFKDKLENIDVVIEDYPTDEEMRAVKVRSKRELLGLYQGIPLRKRTHYYGNVLPDRIVLFKGNIEDICRTEEAIESQVVRTVCHEIAHYFGISDERLKELGVY